MNTQSGRSMVEMLGVLAIIGVLSVGAIAGYSKAMMKYKLNQHAVAVNMLINNVLSVKDKLQHTEELTHYGTLLYKLNLLPDGIEYIRNNLLQDKWFKGDTWIYYYNFQAPREPFGGIGFRVPPTAQGAEICRNIALAAKENAANLYYVVMQKAFNDTNKDVEYQGILYGDAYCTQQNCLRHLDLNKIDNMCNNCNEKKCQVYVIWKQT
ncbi:MAG: type II secretion system protein [Alphaproteobacteria bacterium]|nr:type II secretion system protein [Alphaproteobacteria bacterium]